MDDGSLITHVFSRNGCLSPVALAEGRKILDRLGGDFAEETKDNPSYRMAVDGYFEKDSFRYEGQCSANRFSISKRVENRKNNQSFYQ